MDTSQPLTPEAALRQADSAHAAVRRAGLWRVVGWWLPAGFISMTIIGKAAFPAFLERWDLVILGAVCVVMLAMAFSVKVFDRRSGSVENRLVMWQFAGLLVAAALNRWVLPGEASVWHWVLGGVPLLLTAVATWRVTRR